MIISRSKYNQGYLLLCDVSLTLIGIVDEALPPSARAFQGRLKQELQSLQSRLERLATCERSIYESAAGLEEKQLQFEIARDIVIREKLYLETCKSIKQWEEGLGINKQQLNCSKTHRDNVERSTSTFTAALGRGHGLSLYGSNIRPYGHEPFFRV